MDTSGDHRENEGLKIPPNRTLSICEYMNNLGMTSKSFLQNLLDSNVSEVASRRQFWGTKTGWNSTRNVIKSIKRLVIESDKRTGSQNWFDFILREVSFDSLECQWKV